MRLYVGPITSLFNGISMKCVRPTFSGGRSSYIVISNKVQAVMNSLQSNSWKEFTSIARLLQMHCMNANIYYIAARVQLMAGIKRKASFVWSRKQWQYIAMHEIDTRALSDDWKLRGKNFKAGWLYNIGEMHICIRARTAGATKCCIEETAQLNLQWKNVRLLATPSYPWNFQHN